MLEAVVDTNVFVSGLLKGPTRAIITALVKGKFKLVITEELLDELVFVLNRPKISSFIPESDCEILLALLNEEARFVKPKTRLSACRDPKDNKILEAAVSAKADCIVTGDKDLLVLSPFEGINILPPKEFLALLRKS